MTPQPNKQYMPSFKYRSDWHRYLVFNDPEFINAYNSIDQDDKQSMYQKSCAFELLARSFALTTSDMNIFKLSKSIYIEGKTTGANLEFDPMSGKYSIVFQPDTPLVEIQDELNKFKDLRDSLFPIKQSKRKPPHDPALIYAIFKARRQKLTFNKIFELYENSALPYYSGDNQKYQSREDLEKYYDNNKPIRTLNKS